MKTYITNRFLLPALLAGLGLLLASRATGQVFTTLHSFNNSTNGDGGYPLAGLILSGNTLYGTSVDGGISGAGTMFAISTDGTGFTNLHSFTALNNGTNSDGGYPQAGLIISGNTLYGTASGGGNSGVGTVFAINTDGTGFTNLHSFAGGLDGALPQAGLILSGNTLYGTASEGGIWNGGTVFAINTDGTGFTNLHAFTVYGDNGGNPRAGLILGGAMLYGTTYGGGYYGGTVFAINTNGAGFINLYYFYEPAFNDGGEVSPFDAHAGLILRGARLYGTTQYSYNYDDPFYGDTIPAGGAVFAINTNGTGFTFTDLSSHLVDGTSPLAGLVSSGNLLFGTTSGGTVSGGTVFAVTLNSTGEAAGFTTLHSFTGGSDGVYPQAGLILSGKTLYGTASAGGAYGGGTVFSLSLDSVFAPIVHEQPQDQVVPVGGSATFSIVAGDAAPLAYQWQYDGTNVPGATNTALTLTNVSFSNSGAYLSVLVTNLFGATLSSNALLTVLPMLVSTQPASGIGPAGATLNGAVTPGSSETLVWFEWGADTNYGHITVPSAIGQGFTPVRFASPLTDLPRFGAFHFRAVAWNVLGLETGADVSFLMGGQFPTATDRNGTTWDAVGSYHVEAGELSFFNPPVYSGIQAANLILGNPAPGELYAISISNNFVTHTAHLDGWAESGYLPPGLLPGFGLDENYSFEAGNGYYSGGASAYVQDHSNYDPVNYVWKASTTNWTRAWTPSAALSANWFAVASSTDGSKLAAAAGGTAYDINPIYTSTNSGATWTAGGPRANWQALASSADGCNLVAGACLSFTSVGGSWVPTRGALYTSTNSGATWAVTTAPATNWTAVASSADGTKLAAAGAAGIYTSADSGAHWISVTAPNLSWEALASSADGAKLVAVGDLGICSSTNAGATWTSNNMPNAWTSVAASANGANLVGATSDGNGVGHVYTSTNSGVTWTQTSAPSRYWSSVASSADGRKLTAAGGDTLFISTDAGATWTQTTGIGYAVASSADGNKLVAVVSGGGIYTSQTTPTPLLNITPSSGNALLSRTIPSMDFTLQQNSDLTTTNWTDVPTPPVLNLTNLQNQVLVSLPSGNTFYRLKH